MPNSPSHTVFLHLLLLLTLFLAASSDFTTDVDLTWGGDRAKISENGGLLQLSLDKSSGAGFQSKQEYLYAKIDMKIKVVPSNSAGTVTAYYVCIHHSKHPNKKN